MALNRLGVGIIISARDLASRVVRGVGTRFSRMTRQVERGARRQEVAMRNLAVGAGLMMVGIKALRGLSGSIGAAGKFEQGLAAVGAVSKATTAELASLRDSAIKAGIATQFSPNEAIEGLTSLSTAGLVAKEATDALIPSLDLAAGSLGQLGVAEAANAVVGTLKSYGKGVGEAGIVTDKLLRITQLTNFQARDFEAGLAKAAAAGGVFNQSLNDTLITMGLMRNANIDASSASTAFRESTRRMGADEGAQQAVQAKGVKIFDSRTKKMRSIVDIMMDLDKRTTKLGDKERARVVVQAFGARGLLAFNAVQKAMFTTMVNGEKVTLKGSRAIAALRAQMDTAAGTAAKFREKLLDTFEGQKTLLRGTLETIAVVFGEQFTKVLKPVVKFVVEGLNKILMAYESLSAPVKKAITGVVTFGSALITIIGGAMVLKGALGLLGFSFSGVVMSFAQFLVIGPAVILLVGGIGVAVYALYRAFTKNTGGIASSWQDMVKKIKLGWAGAISIIKGEDFSAAVTNELEKADNSGVKVFLNKFSSFLDRMKVFWTGLKQGFEEGVDALAGSSAMKRLMETFNGVFAIFTGKGMGDSKEALVEWGDKGAETGKKLAQLGEVALDAVNKMVELGGRFGAFIEKLSADDVKSSIDGAIAGFKTMWTTLGDIADVISVIAKGIRLLVNSLQTAMAFFIELSMGLGGKFVAEIQAIGKVFAGDLQGASDVRKRASMAFTFDETKKQAGEFTRVFDPDSTLGRESEIKAEGDKKALRGFLATRREATKVLNRAQGRGEDTSKVAALLETLNQSIWEISKRPPPPLKVSIDSTQIAHNVRQTNKTEDERGIDDFGMALSL